MLTRKDMIPFAVGFATYGMISSGLPLVGAALVISYLNSGQQDAHAKTD